METLFQWRNELFENVLGERRPPAIFDNILKARKVFDNVITLPHGNVKPTLRCVG
jgi:hypothetical protein